jgi:hypothetical protein
MPGVSLEMDPPEIGPVQNRPGQSRRKWDVSLLRIAVLFVPALAGQVALSQGGPPLITDDPGTPGSRNWEINVAYTQSRYSYGTVYEIPHIDLNYGYGPNLQLKLEGPLTIFNGPTANFASLGYTDWGVKWRFHEETKTTPALSTYPQILFVGNNGFSRLDVLDPGTDFFLPLEASKTFGHFIVDGEFGLLFRQFTGSQISTGICSEYDLNKTLALLGEIHYIGSTSLVQDQFVWNLGFKKDLS